MPKCCISLSSRLKSGNKIKTQSLSDPSKTNSIRIFVLKSFRIFVINNKLINTLKHDHKPSFPFKWPETLQERAERELQNKNDLRDKLITIIAAPCDALIANINFAFILQGLANSPTNSIDEIAGAERRKAKLLDRFSSNSVQTLIKSLFEHYL